MADNVSRMADYQKKVGQSASSGSGGQGQLPLYGGGGPPGMDTNPNWKDYIDAKDDAIESRLKTQLSDLATAREVRNNVWGAIGAALAVALATLAFGGDRFDGGMSASSLLREQATIQDRKDKEQDARLQIMDDKLDILIKQTAAK